MPIDILNGTDKLRRWVENNGSYEELLVLESEGLNEYLEQHNGILLY
jgi:hypothetical protein